MQNEAKVFNAWGFVEFSSNIMGGQSVFTSDDSIRDPLVSKLVIMHKEYNPSHYPVDKLSFDEIFIGCDKAQRMSFGKNWSEIIPNFTMEVDPGHKHIERFRSGLQ